MTTNSKWVVNVISNRFDCYDFVSDILGQEDRFRVLLDKEGRSQSGYTRAFMSLTGYDAIEKHHRYNEWVQFVNGSDKE